MSISIGDKVEVVAIDEAFEGTDEYAIGDMYTITDVVELQSTGGFLYDAVDQYGRLVELYGHEIKRVNIYTELRTSLEQAQEIAVANEPTRIGVGFDGPQGVVFKGSLATNDTVASPSHYTQGKVEVIDIIAQTVSGYDDGFTAHCVGTATKYLNRAPHKHDTPIEDLKKAAKYLEFAIAHEEQK